MYDARKVRQERTVLKYYQTVYKRMKIPLTIESVLLRHQALQKPPERMNLMWQRGWYMCGAGQNSRWLHLLTVSISLYITNSLLIIPLLMKESLAVKSVGVFSFQWPKSGKTSPNGNGRLAFYDR
jgi:hypothetical protein